MASSFQEKVILTEYEDVAKNVFALYAALKNESRPRALRRAELKQGEVTAEAVDFLADVELKCKRILNPTQYRLTLRYAAEDRYDAIPKVLQQELGKLFMESNLNYDGDYRVLYFRAKNNRLLDYDQPPQFPEGE
jgi:hypothetical protein